MARHRRREGTQLRLLPEALFITPPVASATVTAVETPTRAAEPPPAVVPPVPPMPVATTAPAAPVGENRAARRKPRPSGLSSADARAMVWLRTQGESLTAIAQQFHVSREIVLRFVRDPMRIRELEVEEQRARQTEGRP